MGIFYIVCGSRIGLLELGGFCCLERKENGMGIRIYSVGIGCVFLFYPRHVGFFGTSSDADNGRDTFVVFFLSAVGWIDNVYTLEV